MANIIELNVGGVTYTTYLETLTHVKDSLLASYFDEDSETKLPTDSHGRYFLDRDGVLFRYILDYLRNRRLILPENFGERERLKCEAEYYRLPELWKIANLKAGGLLPPMPRDHKVGSIPRSPSHPDLLDRIGCITIGYRGTFAFGRDGLVDVKFRKLTRLLVCGKVTLCRLVFGETLNESRDPDRGDCERYTARFFLKHNFIEQAFDMLTVNGFKLMTACGTGTNSVPQEGAQLGAKTLGAIASPESEEARWYHYNEFVWMKNE